MRKGLLVTAVLVVAAAAAFLQWGPGSRPRDALDLPTSGEAEGIGMEALYEGRVVGDVTTGCLFTASATPALIVWPDGFYALDDPPRVVRPNGEAVLTVGETVRMGGGFSSSGSEQCGTTSRWIVSSVE